VGYNSFNHLTFFTTSPAHKTYRCFIVRQYSSSQRVPILEVIKVSSGPPPNRLGRDTVSPCQRMQETRDFTIGGSKHRSGDQTAINFTQSTAVEVPSEWRGRWNADEEIEAVWFSV
jgi:hypothetical protein